MTVSYHLDLSSSRPWSFLKVLFRWRGSIWKSVATELFIWTIFYYKIEFIYRSDWILTPHGKRIFEAVAEVSNRKLDYIPLAFMLGFFVSMVVDRWKNIFRNMGWIENQALYISTYVRGDDSETIMQRRNLVRYLCLAQVLVFRDISMRVRRRFPTMRSVMKGGFLLPHELDMIEKVDINYNKYFVPFNWTFALIYRIRRAGKIQSENLMNGMLKEICCYRTNLAELCNYDWVPIPIAYTQVVFLAVRVYFLLCLVARQFIASDLKENEVCPNCQEKINLHIPFMTMLQFVFYMGWVKVAESLLNPMGEDDDDFEGNYLIDKNITTALKIVDEGFNSVPEQMPDAFQGGRQPLYSAETANYPVGELVGSAAQVTLVQEEEVLMVPHEREPEQKASVSPILMPQSCRSSFTHSIRHRLAWVSMRRPRSAFIPEENLRDVPNCQSDHSECIDGICIRPAELISRQISLPATLSYERVDEGSEEDEKSQSPLIVPYV